MLFDMMFRIGPAIQVIFNLGYEPKEKYFYELTAEQYEKIEKEGNDVSKRWYTIIPDDPKFDTSDILYVSEHEKDMLFDGLNYINNVCDEKENIHFSSFEDKLQFVANMLPPVFSESSQIVKKKKVKHLKLVQ